MLRAVGVRAAGALRRAADPAGAGSAAGARLGRIGSPDGAGAVPAAATRGTRRSDAPGSEAGASRAVGRAVGRGRGTAASNRPRPRRIAPRRGDALHAGAWWLWALGLATAASRTTNPLLLGLLLAVAGYVVAARRTDAPWARSYGAFLQLGLVVLAIRLVFALFFGSPIPGTRCCSRCPKCRCPTGRRACGSGGGVTAEGLVFALYDGLQLATLLVCVGAANALANPARLLKSLPGALYEVGVAVVVALTFAPQLVADVQRLRAARRLRGRPDRRGARRCSRSDCRCWRARWSGRSPWPRRWTPAATAAPRRSRPPCGAPRPR